MPRPILNTSNESKTQTQGILNLSHTVRETHMDKLSMDRILRKNRSKSYMDAMKKLDAGGHVHNQQKVNEIVEVIREEFPEVTIEDVLLGCISICYLGKPYDVHTLDISGGIIEHYKSGQPLPNGMEKARGIALHGGYEFIEVYVDCCRAVSSTGMVSVIKD